jgi:hypothetical protein
MMRWKISFRAYIHGLIKLTPCCLVPLGVLLVYGLVKKFLTLYGIRRYIIGSQKRVLKVTDLLFTGREKIPARNSIYAHAQDYALSDELVVAILKAFFRNHFTDNRQ